MKTILVGRVVVVLALCLAFVLGAAGISRAEKNLTKVEFADLLINRLGLQMPAGSENLTPEEYYEALTNLLIQNQIWALNGTNANDTLTCGELAEALYAVVARAGAEGAVTTEEMYQYLFKRKLMPECDLNGGLTMAIIAQILISPEFTALVAEAFEPLGEGDTRTGFGAVGAAEDNVATII